MSNQSRGVVVLGSEEEEEASGVVYSTAMQLRLASIGLRCGAFLLDYILLMLVPAITVSLALMFKRGTTGVSSIILALGYAATAGLLILNLVYLSGSQGQTLGQRIIGIRLVRTDGTPITYRTAALRHLIGYPLAFLCGGLGILWALWDRRQQGWHDKLAGTLVVKE